MDLRKDFFLKCESNPTRELTEADLVIHDLVRSVYQTTERHLGHLTHVVLAGGYVAYLEGVTRQYNDVDIFLVGTKEGQFDTVMEILRDDIASELKGKFYKSYNEFSSGPVVALVSVRNINLEINIMLTPTIFLDGTGDWISAAVSLLRGFDLGVCMCCLWKSTTRVFRTQHVDLQNRDDGGDRVRRALRLSKYQSRFRTWGTPMTLFVQACYALGLENVGFPMDRLLVVGLE